jgi:MFS transporter, ACDE family, multidrug resistance protein
MEKSQMDVTGTLWEKYESDDEKKKKKRNREIAEKRWAIFSIASIPLVMTLGNSMLIPVLPIMERELNISPFQTSLLITVYSIVAIILIPIAGYLSDKWSRKKVIIPSLIITGIGGLISALAAWYLQSFWLILVGRILQGLGAAGAFPIVLPLVGDMFRKPESVSTSLGIVETANTLGKVLSPIAGAFLASIVWYLPFVSIPIFCFISLLMMIFLVKSPKVKDPPNFKQFLTETKKTFKYNNRWLNSVFFIGGMLMFILFGFLFFLSSRLEMEYGINGVGKGLILAIPLGSLCLSSYITGKLLKDSKKVMKRWTLVGLFLIAGSIYAISFFHNLWINIGLFFVSGIGIGVGLPCLDALITEGIEDASRGTISSFYSSMRFIGVALAPPIIAILLNYPERWTFYILSAMSVICILVCMIGIRPEKN